MVFVFIPNSKCRIVKRINLDESVSYVIQQPHWLARWIWVDAVDNTGYMDYRSYRFKTYEEAQKNLRYWNNSKPIDEVI